MKKYILAVVILALVSLAFKTIDGVEGKMFPTMLCEDYNGKSVDLPDKTMGKYTLVGMAFNNSAEPALKTWIGPVYNKFVKKVDRSKADVFDVGFDYDINLYFIPMFTGLNQLTGNNSKEKIKAATDKELYPYLLFYSGSKTYKAELDFEKRDIPYIFVLDPTGKIKYATSGKFDDAKFTKILDVIEEN